MRLQPRRRPCRGDIRATLPADLNENRLLPANVAPFSATERHTNGIKNTNIKPTAAEKEKTSK